MTIIKLMFTYCPACASKKIRFERNKVFRCPDCGLSYYHNTAAAVACIVRTRAGLLFVEREKEPGKGMLDLPGGFVDPGEGAMDGLRREFIEELNFDPLEHKNGEKPAGFRLFASFPNVYPYKNMSYNTCDLFFYLDIPELSEKDIKTEEAEITSVSFIKAGDLDIERIAFESVRKAVRLYLDTIYKD